MIYGDSYNAVASELIVRPRSHLHSNSQMHHRGSYGDNARGSMSSGRGTPVALDDGSVRQPSFSCGIEEEDMYDREYLENDEDEEEADEEEEEEDMPFAWVDHSMVATHSFDNKVKSDCSMGEDYSNCERDTAFAERKVDGSSPSFSQKNTSYSYVIPPSLVSFPDAPWYESGSAVRT